MLKTKPLCVLKEVWGTSADMDPAPPAGMYLIKVGVFVVNFVQITHCSGVCIANFEQGHINWIYYSFETFMLIKFIVKLTLLVTSFVHLSMILNIEM